MAKNKGKSIKEIAQELGREENPKEIADWAKKQFSGVKNTASRVSPEIEEQITAHFPKQGFTLPGLIVGEPSDEEKREIEAEERTVARQEEARRRVEEDEQEKVDRKEEIQQESTEVEEGQLDNESCYIVIDCRDLRAVLNAGYLASRDQYHGTVLKTNQVRPDEVASTLEGVFDWKVLGCDQIYEGAVDVSNKSKACLVRVPERAFASMEESPLKIYSWIPASELLTVVFKTEKEQKDFVARNSALRGFPTRQLEYIIEPKLQFNEVDQVQNGSSTLEPEVSKTESGIVEANRCIGAVGSLLRHGSLTGSILLDLVAKMKNGIDRKAVVSLIREICSASTATEDDWDRRFNAILDVLAQDDWAAGFDSVHLLQAISKELASCDKKYAKLLDGPELMEVLQGSKESMNLMEDGGDRLLRGLVLLLRTNPLDMDRLLYWNEATTTARPATSIMNVAILLTGWKMGFSAISTLKEEFPFYRFCSQELVRTLDGYPTPALQINETQESVFETRFSLYQNYPDSHDVIAEAIIKPDPGLIEAYAGLEQVKDLLAAEVGFDMEDSLLSVRMGNVNVWGSLHGEETIRWRSSWSLNGRNGSSKWTSQQYQAIGEVAYEASCSVYPLGFPECGLHVDQRLGTQDHEEIRFHLKNICDAFKRLSEVLE